MIEFAWPLAALLLPLPLIAYWLLPPASSEHAALKMPVLLPNMRAKSVATNDKKAPLWLTALIWALLVLATMRPQWLGDPVALPTESREMIIAVDLSGSMQIEDMQYQGQTINRLNMVKALLSDFIERRKGDRLGLLLFADDAYMQAPMTFDTQTIKQMLNESVIGLVGQKTAIGDAIALSVKRFINKDDSNRVLVLLTDGQNTSGKLTPDQALELAVAKDVTVYSIGIGADVMFERSLFGTRKVNPSRDLDEDTLSKIANQTGGRYFRAKDGESMAQIYQLLDQLEPVAQDAEQLRPLTALFFWPLGFALLLITARIVWLHYLAYGVPFVAKERK
ncbi:VWA domain-containing protein [Thalassotalea maritima]|uniref:vWA domain-containing protein n=1 Tax=Thalassotalea maritima TaxID=3242416 RepID=UPI003529C1BF